MARSMSSRRRPPRCPARSLTGLLSLRATLPKRCGYGWRPRNPLCSFCSTPLRRAGRPRSKTASNCPSCGPTHLCGRWSCRPASISSRSVIRRPCCWQEPWSRSWGVQSALRCSCTTAGGAAHRRTAHEHATFARDDPPGPWAQRAVPVARGRGPGRALRYHPRLLPRTLAAGPRTHQTGRLPVLSTAQAVFDRAAVRRRAAAVVPLRGVGPPVYRRDPHGGLPPVHGALLLLLRPRRVSALDAPLVSARRARRLCTGTHAERLACRGAAGRPNVRTLWICRVAHGQPHLPLLDLPASDLLCRSREGPGGPPGVDGGARGRMGDSLLKR